MYTILMLDDKSLCKSVQTTLYQREKLVDKIQFLFPATYEDINLTECDVVLKYVTPDNTTHSEYLIKDEELYKDDYLRCVMNVDTGITKFAGDIILRISFINIDSENGVTEEVLHTGETTITITPLIDYFEKVGDEALEVLDQRILELKAMIEATTIAVESIDKNKADNIVLEDKTLSLTASGNKIGDSVKIGEEIQSTVEEALSIKEVV